jgi:TonB family protein
MDVVSEVLVDRSRELGGLERMLGASVLAHVALVGLVALAPAWWLGGGPSDQPEAVMTISLGGPEGPNTGGLTTMGGRPIQTEAVEARKTIEPVRPPAARAPEMIEPKKAAPKKSEAKMQDDAKDPKGRTPTKGAEVRQGSTIVETSARGQGFGLAAGGFGAGSYLDVANFCCPEYLTLMLDLIHRNWQQNQQAAGVTVVKFTIQRTGAITDVLIERPSGYPALDFMAQRALLATRQLPPLPAAFPEPSLTVHLFFEYKR